METANTTIASNLTSNNHSIPTPEIEFPYHCATLTLCYLVGSLQIGYYVFYILFMGTDSPFRASRAFDYEDFDCQRKTLTPGGLDDMESNANNIGTCSRRFPDDSSTANSLSSITASDASDNDSETGEDAGGDGDCISEEAVRGREEEVEEPPANLSFQSRAHGVRGGGGGASRRLGGLRGPLHRLVQSCSCMLVYNSDDEEDDDDEDEDEDEEEEKKEEDRTVGEDALNLSDHGNRRNKAKTATSSVVRLLPRRLQASEASSKSPTVISTTPSASAADSVSANSLNIFHREKGGGSRWGRRSAGHAMGSGKGAAACARRQQQPVHLQGAQPRE